MPNWSPLGSCPLCMADLKTSPSHICYHAKFGRSMLKCVNVNRGNPKIGECWGCAPLDGRRSRSCTIRNTPLPHVLPCQMWSFCGNGCRPREPQTLGSVGALPFWDGGMADPQKQAPSPYVLPCQIWSFRMRACVHVKG